MVVTVAALDEEQRADLDEHLKGNLCRCTGYRAVREAAGTGPLEPLARSGGVGEAVGAPAAHRVVTGTEPFTLDLAEGDVPPGLLHAAVLRSPHAHARVRAIDTRAAEALPGVHLVLTHRDVPPVLFSTGRHQDRLDDPDDTLVLDPVLRHHGQRVAVAVAESVALAEAALGLVVVDYEVLPAVLDPRRGRRTRRPAGARRQGRRRQPHRRPRAQRRRRAAQRGRRRRGGAGVRARRRRGHLAHPARRPRRAGDARRGGVAGRARAPGRAQQHPGAVPGARRARPRPRPRPGPGARPRRPGGRGFRRQAGDADGGPRRARGAAHRPSRAVRDDPPRSAHRAAHPAPDGRPGPAGGHRGRDPHRPRGGPALRRRRLRQPLPGGDVPLRARVGGDVPVREQAGRRPGRLHELGALRRVPRVRPRAGRVRPGVGAGRPGPRTRPGPVHGAPQERRRPRRPVRRHLRPRRQRRGRRFALRQLRPGPVPGPGGTGTAARR